MLRQKGGFIGLQHEVLVWIACKDETSVWNSVNKVDGMLFFIVVSIHFYLREISNRKAILLWFTYFFFFFFCHWLRIMFTVFMMISILDPVNVFVCVCGRNGFGSIVRVFVHYYFSIFKWKLCWKCDFEVRDKLISSFFFFFWNTEIMENGNSTKWFMDYFCCGYRYHLWWTRTLLQIRPLYSTRPKITDILFLNG